MCYDGQNAAEELGMFCPAVCARIPTGKMSQDTSSIECKLILNMLVRLVNGNKCSSSSSTVVVVVLVVVIAAVPSASITFPC